MLERDDQVARLQYLFEQATLGFGHLVFIGGVAGAGKSLLVRTFTESIAAQAQVLIGWCDRRRLRGLLDPSSTWPAASAATRQCGYRVRSR